HFRSLITSDFRLLQPTDAQPSPLALLAATCSKIGGVGGEGQTATQQQIIIDPNQGLFQLQNPTQQLELVPAQLTGNGWQIIATSPAAATKDSVQQNESAARRKVKAAGSNNAPGSQQQQQFQIIQVQNLPNSSGGIQYQVIPHLQTADGQQIQISPSNPTALSVQPEQIQLIPAGNNQAILATPQRAGSTGFVTQNQTIPFQIRPSPVHTKDDNYASSPKNVCHELLTLMSFQTRKTFVHLRNTNEDILMKSDSTKQLKCSQAQKRSKDIGKLVCDIRGSTVILRSYEKYFEKTKITTLFSYSSPPHPVCSGTPLRIVE
uniref:Sp4 transcription factor n=1 Tax=Sinocyclocheilus anshuiensis TaxID=1608454 RepID=A0A671RR23_9TELE